MNIINLYIKIKRYLFNTHRWSLMYRKNNRIYYHITQPNELSRADSFIVNYDGINYIFFEEFKFEEFKVEKDGKGYLCVGELDTKKNSLKNIRKILEKPYHLSYPHIFQYNDKWYMIPETSANNTIDLYQFTNFPYELKKVKTLLKNIKAVDSTLLIKDGLFYLFTNVDRSLRYEKNLSIFYTDDLLKGDFVAHPQNPINTDPRYSRMAGGIVDNKYRFSQDCKASYGFQMYKFEILELTKIVYKEKLIGRVYKPTDCISSHTYSKYGDIEIIDVSKKTNVEGMFKNLICLFRKLAYKLLVQK